MRKTILFLAILAICGGSAFSQTTEPTTNNTDNPTNSQWTIGAAVGVTLNVHDAGVGYMKAFSYTPYFGIGADLKVRYNVTNWLACRSGFYIMGKNYVLMHEKVDNIDAYGTLAANNYIGIPLMADISIGNKVKWNFLLGGYAGYWASARRKGTSIPILEAEGHEMLTEHDYQFNSVRDNRFDAGIVAGVGLAIPCSSKIDIDVEMLYYHGLTDVQKVYMREHNPRYNSTVDLNVGVSYHF